MQYEIWKGRKKVRQKATLTRVDRVKKNVLPPAPLKPMLK